jgi:hypothetical protein
VEEEEDRAWAVLAGGGVLDRLYVGGFAVDQVDYEEVGGVAEVLEDCAV